MKKLSVTIITLNEEHNIEECLKSVSWADEIVVIDSFSSDNTTEICRRYTDNIFQNKFPGHIEQKNIAIDRTTNEWILSIDADERVSPELKEEILGVFGNGGLMDGYAMPRRSWYLGRWIAHSGWYPNRHIRLFKKERGKWGGVNPHDSITVHGPVGRLNGDILHYPYEDIAQNLRTIDNFTTISAREMHKQGKRAGIFDFVLRPHLTFLKKYIANKGFLDGMPGLIICSLTAYYAYSKYAKLWELNSRVKGVRPERRQKENPRVLHINTEKGWRGGESQTLYLAQGLKATHHHTVIIGQPDSAMMEKADNCGIKAIPVSMRHEFDVPAVLTIARIMREERIDVCHMHTPHSVTLGAAAAAIAKVPVTVVSRRVDFSLRGNPFRKIKYQWGIDKIIAISKGVQKVLINDGIPREKIELVYEGVTIDNRTVGIPKETILKEFGIENGAPIVGNIAHLTDHKGHRFLLDAIPMIVREIPGIRFIILGKGELEQELKARARGLGIEQAVIFAGFRKEVSSFLNIFDIFVMPSRLEGLCTSILDAMAAGLPVVASRVGGIPELVEDDVTGALVTPENPELLAGAIIALIGDGEKRREMGERAKERVKGFSAEKMVNETVSLYHRLLQGKPRNTKKTDYE